MSGSEDNEVSKDDAEPQEVEPYSVPATYKTRGKLSDADATGVFGYNTAGSGTGKGVGGHVESGFSSAAGVHGEADNASGSSSGVVGITNGTGSFSTLGFTLPATGVTGRATQTDAVVSYGVQGINSSNSDFDAGVLGWAVAGSGEVFGVRGETNSKTTGAAGVYGDANDSTGQVYGVRGNTGSVTTGSAGVFGNASTGQVYGVKGSVISDSGSAVHADGRLTATATIPGSNSNETDHAAVIENDVNSSNGDAQVMMLSMPLQGTSPGDTNNFLTFKAGKDIIGAIEGNGSGGVSLDTSAGDLGEYFPLSDPTVESEEGEVLGLSGGELSRDTDDADAALVVTRSPAVLGNNPNAGENEPPESMESVALIGQVPVKVTESVDAGDRLVAEGDGTARVGGPDDDALTVGRALESVTVADDDVETVRTFVGGPMSETPMSTDQVDPNDVVEAEYEETIAELRRENERLSEENQELKSRLEELEGTVEGLVADDSAANGPEPADD